MFPYSQREIPHIVEKRVATAPDSSSPKKKGKSSAFLQRAYILNISASVHEGRRKEGQASVLGVTITKKKKRCLHLPPLQRFI